MEHKKNRFRRLKLTGIAAVTALLLFVSCTGEPSTSGGAAEGESFSNPVKKAAFYDTSLHQDKLAIRYFDLEAGEKSGDASCLRLLTAGSCLSMPVFHPPDRKSRRGLTSLASISLMRFSAPIRISIISAG